MAYDDAAAPSWGTSDIRTWLNGTFYDAAFSSVEKSSLVGDDKVRLLTKVQAQNTAYFGNDAVRATTCTALAVSHGNSEDNYWLADGDALTCVDSAGTLVPATATAIAGVRPVIRIDADDIALVAAASQPPSPPDNVLSSAINLSSSYTLALRDDTLPSIAVSGYSTALGELTINCTPSKALTGGQKIFCYLQDMDDVQDSAALAVPADGKITLTDYTNPERRYKVMLAVTTPGGTNQTSVAGKVATLSIDNLAIAGIKKGDRFGAGQTISFTGKGWTSVVDNPKNGDLRWVPAEWSIGAKSGTWNAAPYDATVSLEPGDYTLTVSYAQENYSDSWARVTGSGIEVERSVAFHVDKALALSSSVANGTIEVGKSIKLTPNLTGGKWTYDSKRLSLSGNTFTGKQTGTTTVKYAFGRQSISYAIKVVPAPVGTPTGVKAASVGHTSVKVSWGKVDGATGYQLYRATSKTGSFTKVADTKSLNYTNKSLTTGKTYYYKVRAYRTADSATVYGADSPVVSAKPKPMAPAGMKASRVSNSSIKVSWKKVTGATKYQVYRATSKTGKYTKVTETTSLSYTNKKLTDNKTYYYKVRAYHTEKGVKVYGAYSTVVKAKP